jgi:integrase
VPRQAKGFWDDRSKRYYARLGEVNPKTGKRRAFMLKHEDGRTIGQGDDRAVAAAIQRRLAELDAEDRRAGGGPTVSDLCQAFINWHAENGSAGRTVQDHHYHLNRFCEFAPGGVRNGDRAAASIEPADVWALDGNFGSLRLLYASVIACWNWAARPVKGRPQARLLSVNPLFRMKKPPRGKIVRKRAPWQEVRRLLRFAAGRAKGVGATRRDRTRTAERLRVLCLRFIAVTGCRPGEAASLEWGDLDLGRGFCVIPSERTKTRKTGRDRRFSIGRGLAKALAAAKRSDAAHPRWVFVPAWSRANGAPAARELMRWWRESLKPAAIEHGVDLPAGMTLYWLRHEFQSLGLEVASAEEVSAVAGNSPKVLLETYTHNADEAAVDVAGRIASRRRRKSS